MLGLQGGIVDADDDHGVELVLRRGRQNDLLGAGRQVLRAIGLVREYAGALEGHVNLQGGPRKLGGVLDGADGDRDAVDHDIGAVGLHYAVKAAVHAVILQQVGQHLGIGQVVDADDVELLAPRPHGTKNDTADAPEPVNPDVNSHPRTSLAVIDL